MSEFVSTANERKEGNLPSYIQSAEELTADLFVSEMLFDSRLGGRRIRFMLENHIINSVRELYTFSAGSVNKDKKTLFSQEEWLNIRSCLLDDKARQRARDKADTCILRGIHSVNRDDEAYPFNLRKLEGMPIVLYWMGDLSITGSGKIPSCAIVGSRQPTCYGVSVTREISRGLTDHGVCIVSGLARGIDTVAHESALLGGGKTIAVLAGGLDEIYPPENRDLFEKISKDGLVLSEMPPGQKALRQYFPARNRILSGLSDLVAIMEAGEFSGTLHTASFAAAQGRDVFVVPGTIYAQQSRGNLKLIQDGADLLLSVEDILARLAGLTFFREMDEIRQEEVRKGLRKRQKTNAKSLTHEECIQVVSDQLSLCEQSMDELIKETGISFSQMAPLLSELELVGRVVCHKQRYALTFLRV